MHLLIKTYLLRHPLIIFHHLLPCIKLLQGLIISILCRPHILHKETTNNITYRSHPASNTSIHTTFPKFWIYLN